MSVPRTALASQGFPDGRGHVELLFPLPPHLAFNVHLWIFILDLSKSVHGMISDLKGNKMSVYGFMYLTLKYSILLVNFVTATAYSFEGFRTYYNWVD